jgi:glycosyltransferase involved in cell wall biosynthesis
MPGTRAQSELRSGALAELTCTHRPPALVHDYLLVMRGAERTFAAIADCFPSAPIHTLLFDPVAIGDRFGGRRIHHSYLQRLGFGQSSFRTLLPLLPRAAERLPIEPCDLVISSSSAFAHGVRPDHGAVHVSYCHSPFRYAWHEQDRASEQVPPLLRPALRRVLSHIRQWDRDASERVTHYIANSAITRERIGEFWGREATVVHPPVDVDRFRIGVPEHFLLIVCELVAHKRVDHALEAARRAGQPVKVVGAGPELERLRAAYGGTAEFLGRVSDRELERLYQRARALVVSNVEEFGIAAVEAQASGRPVVGTDAGGTRETVVDGETGVLVPAGDVDDLAEAVRYTDFDRFSPARIRQHAARFSTSVFQRTLVAEVARISGAAVVAGAATDRPPERFGRAER